MLWKKKSFFSDFICNIHETQTLLDIRNLNKNIIYTSVNKKKKHLETVSDFVAVKYRTGNL